MVQRLPSAILCLAALIAPAMALGQSRDALVEAFMERHHVPGLAFVILQNGSLISRGEYGVTNLHTKERVSVNSVFPIASLSKPFVALGILSLSEKRMLRLDEPVGKYLPSLPDDWKPIPIVRLLDHTSGVPDHFNAGKWDVFDPAPVPSDELIKKLTTLPLDFHYGDRFNYSNGNYALLAKVIEVVSGKLYGEYLADHIFKPLGMQHTKVLTSADLVTAVQGYKTKEGKLELAPFNPDWCFGNGAIGATSIDLARLDIGLYTDRIVRQSTLKFITTPQPLNDSSLPGYAMGWMLGSNRGVKSINHNGKVSGWRCCLVRYIESNLSVIVLSNNGDEGLYSLASDLGGTIVADLALNPMRDDNPDLTNSDRKFVDSIIAGTVNVSTLSEGLAKDYETKEHWKAIREPLVKEGEMALFAPCSRSSANGIMKTTYRVEQGNSVRKMVIGRDSEGIVKSLMFYGS